MNTAPNLRAALGSFVTGVTIVTASDGAGRDVGVTANSFNSVSLDPPMVLWSLARKSGSLPVFAGASHFVVHVLAADQEALSNRFAKAGEEKFAGIEIERGTGGAPLLPGTAARFQCRTAYQYDGGDHVIFVGEVERFESTTHAPLAFHGGRYAVAARKAANLSTARAVTEPGVFGEDFLGYLLGRAHFQLYDRLRPMLTFKGMTAREHFALSAIGIMGKATPDQVGAAIGYTGERFDDEAAQVSVAAGRLLRCDDGRLELSHVGRADLIELTAAAMAAEGDVTDALDESELAMLRHLLKRAIAVTNPGLPDLWSGRAPEG
ncbi:flavin reductase family protein [Leptolyngbya sp. 15MV]|nr:flavin reductase family protein [Leptolyngbya sp. 15MV]